MGNECFKDDEVNSDDEENEYKTPNVLVLPSAQVDEAHDPPSKQPQDVEPDPSGKTDSKAHTLPYDGHELIKTSDAVQITKRGQRDRTITLDTHSLRIYSSHGVLRGRFQIAAIRRLDFTEKKSKCRTIRVCTQFEEVVLQCPSRHDALDWMEKISSETDAPEEQENEAKNDAFKRGHLEKLRTTGFKAWQRRYVVIRADYVKYFKEVPQSPPTLKGQIPTSNIVKVIQDVRNVIMHFTEVGKQEHRVMTFRAPDAEEAKKWSEAFLKAQASTSVQKSSFAADKACIQGVIEKKSPNVLQGWQKRLIVVHSKEIQYYNPSGKLAGLKGAISMKRLAGADPQVDGRFVLYYSQYDFDKKRQDMEFRCRTNKEAVKWCKAINQEIMNFPKPKKVSNVIKMSRGGDFEALFLVFTEMGFSIYSKPERNVNKLEKMLQDRVKWLDTTSVVVSHQLELEIHFPVRMNRSTLRFKFPASAARDWWWRALQSFVHAAKDARFQKR